MAFGNTINKFGFRYTILPINRATKYVWVYGVKSLVSACVINALEQFRSNIGALPKQFCCDCGQKLLGYETQRWIYHQQSKIIGALPAGNPPTAWLSAHGLPCAQWHEHTLPRHNCHETTGSTPSNTHVE